MELERTLRDLDRGSAVALETLVRDAMALVRPIKTAVGPNGWPVDYFESTAGSLAGQPFDVPNDPAPEPCADW